MTEKVGRNDICPCGSGKKYKQCCFLKEQQQTTSVVKRKFTAKVISSGSSKSQESEQVASQREHKQAIADYNTLMERAFGSALTSDEGMPPLPEDPSKYLVSHDEQ